MCDVLHEVLGEDYDDGAAPVCEVTELFAALYGSAFISAVCPNDAADLDRVGQYRA